MRSRHAVIAALGVAIVAFAACRNDESSSSRAGVSRTSTPPATPLVLSTIPEFRFTNEAGAPFGTAELAGKPWIANFIFTRCPTICPMFTAKMADVQTRVKAGKLDVHLVSFSVDPAFDKPEVLAAYAKEHGADPARWTFLTGDPEAIRNAIVTGLKVAAQPVGADQDLASVFHGSHFVLVDAQGRIRGYYDSADADATERMLADLRRL